MSLYSDALGSVREIDSALVEAWQEAGNPKADGLTLLPPRPSEGHEWDGSAWVIPPQPLPESVTARQIRLWLVSHGISLSAVESTIDGIADPMQRDMVRIEWEYAPYVERAHPMLVPLAAALGLSEAQVDVAFREAAVL
jgi:hypothetical protein